MHALLCLVCPVSTMSCCSLPYTLLYERINDDDVFDNEDDFSNLHFPATQSFYFKVYLYVLLSPQLVFYSLYKRDENK